MASAQKGGTFRIHITGADKVSGEFKEARKKIRSDIRGHVIELGTRIILPHVKMSAPSIAKHALTVKASAGAGYIGVKGARKFDRIIGLWNFGGTVKSPIKPTTKQALVIRGTGAVVASVTTPRHYKGTRKIDQAVRRQAPSYFDALTKQIMNAFDGLEHTSG